MERSKVKKILIVTGIFPPQDGGPATYSKLLLDKLPALGFSVKVESFGYVLHLPKVIRHVWFFFKIVRHMRWADLIYAQDPVSVGVPSFFASVIFRKKFYLKIVGDYAWEQGSQRFGVTDLLDEFSVNYSKYPMPVRLFKKIEKYVAKKAEKVIVPSQYLKKIVTNWGINQNKIFVIYNAFNPPTVNLSKEELRNKYSFKSFTIVSPGRLVPWKGFLELIDLIPDLKKINKDVKLVIIGEGPLRGEIESKVMEKDLKESVILLGRLPHIKALEVIKASDLFVLNTSYEGFSHFILEAQALGTPVITTEVGGNVEIIVNEENGLLLKYNDKKAIKEAIQRIIFDPELGKNLAKKGIEKVKQFKEEKMLSEISNLLN